jgi:2-oxoglutarate dehydrogenase E1 component
VCNITTPANYFHALRRQLHREFRKPLVIMAPKALLRHPQCKSRLAEFDDEAEDALIQGVRFKRLIMDESATSRAPNPPPEPGFKRVVFCSGKIYYDLYNKRAELGLNKEIAICRIEQLAPFPFDLVSRELRRYPNAEVMWCQEEPMNMGGFYHVVPRMNACIRAEGRQTNGRLKYSGRAAAASTATGFGEVHAEEQRSTVANALDMSF